MLNLIYLGAEAYIMHYRIRDMDAEYIYNMVMCGIYLDAYSTMVF